MSMALNFVTGSEQPTPPQKTKGKFKWDDWYQKNRTTLLQKRATRYATDPAYRKAVIDRSRAARAKKVKPEVEHGGWTLAFNDMAEELNVSPWVLRQWRKREFYPQPHERQGRLWFKPEHVKLLAGLTMFQGRLTKAAQAKLDNVVSTIFANW